MIKFTLSQACLGSFLLMSACSILVQKKPFCGDGTKDPGEICFSEERLVANLSPAVAKAVDLDNDGDLDLVNSNFFEATITIFLNDGTGKFGAPASFKVFDGPFQIVVDNFVGDSNLDVAVACVGVLGPDGAFVKQSVVSILEGDGQGGFLSEQDFPLGDALLLNFVGAQALTAGDLNSDGLADIVVNSAVTENMAVLFNNNGTFNSSAPIELRTIASPLGIAIGDVDQDQDLDILCAEFSDIINGQPTINNKLTIFLNEKDPVTQAVSFPQTVSLTVDPGPTLPIFVDLDNDQDLDIAVSHPVSNTISVLLNEPTQGQISFPQVRTFSAGVSPTGLDSADLDADGDVDLVVAEFGADSIGVFVNEGGGEFTSLTPIKAGKAPETVSVGDINGDSIIDLIAPNLGNPIVGNSNDLSILLSTP
jgi:hypothetical protein